MRFTLILGLGDCSDYSALARAAEASNWNALSILDSIFYPKITESDYHLDNFDIGELKLSPAPTNTVPVLFGRHTKPVLRGAARLR